ncbi:MAG: hypothetical protein BroJett025_07600 [Patescibacteria group bacterium]|nr:MAG: hypothetical protein BroJett025_07600 [Patescibacteria group bacterium]
MQTVLAKIRRPYVSVIYKVLFVCLIVISIIASGVSLVIFRGINDRAITDKTNELKRIADYQEERLAYEFSVSQRLVKILSQDEKVINFLEGDQGVLHQDIYRSS